MSLWEFCLFLFLAHGSNNFQYFSVLFSTFRIFSSNFLLEILHYRSTIRRWPTGIYNSLYILLHKIFNYLNHHFSQAQNCDVQFYFLEYFVMNYNIHIISIYRTCYIPFLVVVILCFLCTVTTNFEYELRCSTVGFDFSNGERCVPKSTDDSTLCGLAGFDASCQKVSFDISTGKPCTLNQTNTSGSCQEVMINSIFRHFFHLLCIFISNFYSP